MSITGHLTFYTEQALPDPQTIIAKVLRLGGKSKGYNIIRLLESDRSWELLLEAHANPSTEVTIEVYEDPQPSESYRVHDLEEAARSYTGENSVAIEYGGERFRGLESIIFEAIPEDIRDDAAVWGPIVTIGWHDIFTEKRGEPHLFSRAFFSFELWGYSSPHKPDEYERLIFEIPEIKQLKADLEEITGPLEQCIYWVV